MDRLISGAEPFTRRAVLRDGSLLLLGTSLPWAFAGQALTDDKNASPQLRIGLVTDLHYADKPPAGSRHYRESLAKLAEAAAEFQTDRLDFMVELGDLVDAADTVDEELGYLKRIDADFSTICPRRHYVLGNHCVYTLTKEEFLGGVGQQRSYYSFDAGDFHFVVLDSCFCSDGAPYGRKNFKWTDPNIPAAELQWLQADLNSTARQSIVFAHQRLDGDSKYCVNNAAEVREVLEKSGKVLAVFQGHSHQNDYHDIAGIHYCTLVAMIEGSGAEHNGYSIMNIYPDGAIRLAGSRQQASYGWQA